MGPFCAILGRFGSPLGPPLDGHFGPPFWVHFVRFWVVLGPFYAILGPFSAILGHFGSPLGPPLDGHFGTAILLPFCAILGPFCAILGPFR